MAVPARPTSGAPIETTWGDVVHDSIAAQDLQAGKGTLTITASTQGDLVVTFPRPFAAGSAPIVVATVESSGVQLLLVGLAAAPTATSFTARGSRKDGASTSTSFGFDWIAYGPRA